MLPIWEGQRTPFNNWAFIMLCLCLKGLSNSSPLSRMAHSSNGKQQQQNTHKHKTHTHTAVLEGPSNMDLISLIILIIGGTWQARPLGVKRSVCGETNRRERKEMQDNVEKAPRATDCWHCRDKIVNVKFVLYRGNVSVYWSYHELFEELLFQQS